MMSTRKRDAIAVSRATLLPHQVPQLRIVHIGLVF